MSEERSIARQKSGAEWAPVRWRLSSSSQVASGKVAEVLARAWLLVSAGAPAAAGVVPGQSFLAAQNGFSLSASSSTGTGTDRKHIPRTDSISLSSVGRSSKHQARSVRRGPVAAAGAVGQARAGASIIKNHCILRARSTQPPNNTIFSKACPAYRACPVSLLA